MPDPLILYSTNTWLAYSIAQQYYLGIHYVWCTPYFDSKSLSGYDAHIPSTSSTSEIYHSLYEEVRRGDQHSAKIKENKVGILKGATYNREAEVITEKDESDIAAIVDLAETRDFRPLLYIIPFQLITDRVVTVPIVERAHPLSIEYIIESLPRQCFDIIELIRT